MNEKTDLAPQEPEIERIELKLQHPAAETITYQGTPIIIKKRYLSTSEMEELEEQYTKIYFGNDEEGIPSSPDHAEYFLLTAILDLCTNIKVVDGNQPVFTFDQMYSHFDLVQQIRTRILNYSDFYARLQSTIRHMDLEKNSLKSAIDYGYAKLQSLLEELPERLEKIKLSEQDMENVKEVSKSPILKEAVKIFKSNQSPSPKRNKRSKSK